MKNSSKLITVLFAAIALVSVSPAFGEAAIGINVLFKSAITQANLNDLAQYGTVLETTPEIKLVTMKSTASQLPAIRGRSYVAAANPDAERKGSPVDTVAATNFANGISTWDMDAVNVTASPGFSGRAINYDGTGVYVAVLDTGLVDSWRQYFPEQRIATQYAMAFRGGGGENGNVSDPTNMWEHDQNSHGTHVTSTILGYNLFGTPVNGVAPKATIIPVKVLGQNGSGWSSVIAHAIVYVANLKTTALGGAPVVINESLGGPQLDAAEQAAMDYAISKGVIIVAAAGNEGNAGMGYPGAYAPVISVAATGWTGQWLAGPDGNPNNWWNADDVADPTRTTDFYIADFSSREKPGQQLDVAAPGSWTVGPYQVNSGQLSYYYLSGTSMATPHVAGIVALMCQKKPSLTAAAAESILKSTAIKLPPGSRTVALPGGATEVQTWGSDATGAGIATADAALKAMK
ncbi:MAG TPA: S8 family serine peptidase [Chthoniobacterales bacterium]|nr:S8 family serine peptidase [Chthoniobacterales bacterium]